MDVESGWESSGTGVSVWEVQGGMGEFVSFFSADVGILAGVYCLCLCRLFDISFCDCHIRSIIVSYLALLCLGTSLSFQTDTAFTGM